MDVLLPPANILAAVADALLPPPVLVAPKGDLIPGIPDGILAIFAPVIAYWTYSTFFHIIDVYELAEKYRIHPSEEEELRNKAPLRDVLFDVVVQHIIQLVVAYAVYRIDPPPTTGHELYQIWYLKHNWAPSWVSDSLLWFAYTYGWLVLRMGFAFCIIDTWQYWLHRTMHLNKTLYRRFHSRHHRLYVPYAYGALYNDPVEGFLLDTVGTGIAGIVTQLSPRESLFVYVFATMKTVDDHCGYRLPWDPFQFLFPNNAIYHDIHHQNWGFRNNFSQPFFTIWDRISNTQYQFVQEYKDKQNKITLEKYKLFLARRQERKDALMKKSASTASTNSTDSSESNTAVSTPVSENKKTI
ncbi:hypothetical protein C7M61_004284 [Candidozyma pseudohaemuli]|uniref:Fatty acid hydroxylase domain-containing protein n=1 Tax=Candidozyma pseudohaemuli TaxID=418784 RepID=A0A2P7YIL5_9ASCO|nr:hypothetical protein C7M61_004284 [[Candida] pseudohaemulonii]PSK35802.1 hypothetical protein C7M61_004284 [[Candida] pseudohaemulonii]